jgi:hypothetical protein
VTGIATSAVLLSALAVAPDAELALNAENGFEVIAQVNGASLRLRVDPGASGLVLLNPAAAERAGLRPRRFDDELARSLGLPPAGAAGAQMGVVNDREVPVYNGSSTRTGSAEATLASATTALGPVKMRGKLAHGDVRLGDRSGRWLFSWFDREVVDGADGLISPAALPFDRVSFRLREPQPGERPLAFVVSHRPLSGLHFQQLVQNRNVTVRLSVLEPATTATAAAGAVIASALDGKWVGAQRRHAVGLGVLRPARPLSLAKPLQLQQFSLTNLLVRSRDHRGNLSLPAELPLSADELLVTAPSSQAAQFALTIGQDSLERCSRVTYVRPNRLELDCRED